MSNEELLAEVRTAGRHIETALWVCHQGNEIQAHKIAAMHLEMAHTEIQRTLLMLAQVEDDMVQLEDLELSVRTYHILKRSGIDTIEQLVQKTRKEVASVRGMGSRSFNEIVRALETIGTRLREE